MYELILIPLLSVACAALGVVGTLYILKKYIIKEINIQVSAQVKAIADQLGDDVFENAMPLIEEKIYESTIVDTLIQKLFESLQHTFNQEKGLTTRRQNSLSKKVTHYLLDQAPMAKLILDEIGATETLEKDPSLLIWGIQKFPWLFNIGETQSLNTSNSINPMVNNYGETQGFTETLRRNGVQEGVANVQAGQEKVL